MTFVMYLETINCIDCRKRHDVVFAQRLDDQEDDGRIGHLLTFIPGRDQGGGHEDA